MLLSLFRTSFFSVRVGDVVRTTYCRCFCVDSQRTAAAQQQRSLLRSLGNTRIMNYPLQNRPETQYLIFCVINTFTCCAILICRTMRATQLNIRCPCSIAHAETITAAEMENKNVILLHYSYIFNLSKITCNIYINSIDSNMSFVLHPCRLIYTYCFDSLYPENGIEELTGNRLLFV